MSLQERLQTIRSSPIPSGEESAKVKIVLSILQDLDWDPYGPEVLLEHAVGGKEGGKVDLALRGPEHNVALIEAKAPGSSLDEHVEQLMKYAFSEPGGIGVLTTGLEWWLYLPRESGYSRDRRFAVLRVTEDPVEQLVDDFSAFLSKEALLSGQAEKQAKVVLEARRNASKLSKRIPSIWQDMLEEPDADLVELLTRRIYKTVNLRPTKQQLETALSGSPIWFSTGPIEPDQSLQPLPPQEQSESRTRRRSAKPRAIELWGDQYRVSTHKDCFTTLIRLLYERNPDDFDRHLDNFEHASRNPQQIERGRFELANSGWFFDAHGSAENLARRARRLLELFGYSASDYKVLLE